MVQKPNRIPSQTSKINSFNTEIIVRQKIKKRPEKELGRLCNLFTRAPLCIAFQLCPLVWFGHGFSGFQCFKGCFRQFFQ